MKHKISKAQQEVWEWKEKAYEQIKDMSLQDAMKFILNHTSETVVQIWNKQHSLPIASEPKPKYGKK